MEHDRYGAITSHHITCVKRTPLLIDALERHRTTAAHQAVVVSGQEFVIALALAPI